MKCGTDAIPGNQVRDDLDRSDAVCNRGGCAGSPRHRGEKAWPVLGPTRESRLRANHRSDRFGTTLVCVDEMEKRFSRSLAAPAISGLEIGVHNFIDHPTDYITS